MAENTSGTPSSIPPPTENEPASQQSNYVPNVRRRTGIGWDYGTELPPIGKVTRIKCDFCGIILSGGGINRFKQHIAGITGQVRKCKSASETARFKVKEHFDNEKKKKQASNLLSVDVESDDDIESETLLDTNDSGKRKKTNNIGSYMRGKAGVDTSQPTIKSKILSRERVLETDFAVATWFFDACIPLNAVNSPFFEQAITRIANMGTGYVGPSYHALRTNLLAELKSQSQLEIDDLKKHWVTSGCTIMADGWTDRRHRSLINFLVYCPKGLSFIKSVDASDIVSSADNLCKLFSDVIDLVGVENVVHVVTDNAANYKKAGSLLEAKYPSLFWSPCAAHCVNLIMKDICELPLVKTLAQDGAKVTSFVYNRKWVLAWLRKKEGWTEIISPGATRFGTVFIALSSLYERRGFLKQLVDDPGFEKFRKEVKGNQVRAIIVDDRFWSNVDIIVKVMTPIMRLLRLCDSDEKPSLGYVYDGVARAINGVKKVFGNRVTHYSEYTDIIDNRWDKMLQKSLHVAAFFFNPVFQYSDSELMQSTKIMSCVWEVLEKLVPDEPNVVREVTMFIERQGSFGIKYAVRGVHTSTPENWWSLFGGDAPNLQKVAIKLLSQTSSSSGCERNWSVFERLHTKKRNRLEHERLNDLVFVHYNLRLKMRSMKKKAAYDPIDYEHIDRVDEWIVEEDTEEDFTNEEIEDMLRGADVASSSASTAVNEVPVPDLSFYGSYGGVRNFENSGVNVDDHNASW